MHPAESLHWYTRDGEPCYEVMSAKPGVMRPTTLRDARKLNLVPSVTTIIRCAAAPGLELWKQQQVMMSALTLPRPAGEPETDWLKRVMQDSQEQAKRARDRGTAIHAAIQGAYEDETPTPGFEPYIQGACSNVAELGISEWTAELSFAHPIGFGGKCDLSSRAGFVIDFKTKEFDQDDDLKTWDEHAMQLAAYRVGLGIDSARCAIVYVSTTVPGLCRLIEIPQEDLAKGWKCFYSLLHYWQAKSGYVSSFERLAA
jgi:hypothetical protein